MVPDGLGRFEFMRERVVERKLEWCLGVGGDEAGFVVRVREGIVVSEQLE